MTQETTGKTKKISTTLAAVTILVLLSGVFAVPLSAFADDGHNEKNGKDNDNKTKSDDRKDNDDKTKSDDRKDKDDDHDKDKNHTCESEKYEKQCNDIAADQKDIASDNAKINKAQSDIAADIAKGQTKDVAKDQKALAKAQADLAADVADLTADLAGI